jgi:hypothetical protein
MRRGADRHPMPEAVRERLSNADRDYGSRRRGRDISAAEWQRRATMWRLTGTALKMPVTMACGFEGGLFCLLPFGGMQITSCTFSRIGDGTVAKVIRHVVQPFFRPPVMVEVRHNSKIGEPIP